MKTFVTSKLILLFMVLQLLCSFKRFGAMITFDVGYFFKAIHLGNAKVNLVKTLFVLFIRAENIKWWMSSMVEVGSSIYIWDMMEVGTSSTYSPIFNSLYSCISKLDSFYSYFFSRSSISSLLSIAINCLLFLKVHCLLSLSNLLYSK